MTRKFYVLAFLGCLFGSSSSAHHIAAHNQNPNPPPPVLSVPLVTFEAGSLIIPMDGCYARMSFMGNTELDNVVAATYESAAANSTNKVCNTAAQKDDAIIPTYSLVQRLMLDGIPVHWAIKGSKSSFNDWDLKITKAGGGPVIHRTRTGGTDSRYSGLVEIRYAGAPFIIDKADAAAAIAKIATYTQTSPGVDYDGVDFHEAQVSFTAPIYASLTAMPKVAIIDTRDAGTSLGGQPGGYNNMIGAIDEAIMDDMTGTWFKIVSISDVNAGKLVTDGYQLAWVPSFDLSGAATAAQTTFLANLALFADAGGHLLFQDGGVGALEGFGTFAGVYTSTQPTTTGYMTGVAGGLLTNGTSGTFDNGDSGAGANESATGSDFSDPASQWGGMVWTGIGGSKYNWQPRTDKTYLDGVRRMVFSKHATDDTKSRWDFAAWRHKDNDTAKGVIYYLGGDNWRRVTASGFRILLNTIFVVAANGGIKEVSRATPVIAQINGTTSLVQGSFEFVNGDTPKLMTAPADVTAFRFPFRKGHLRARKADGLAGSISTTAKTFGDGSVTTLFDAADHIPTVAAGGCGGATASNSCRVVFTNTVAGLNPPRVAFDTTNAATLGPIMTQALPYAPSTLTSTEYPTLISRVLAGTSSDGITFTPKLGGVDRSTVAVIPASTVAKPGDGTTRATIAYFGATDGMLHAVCASTQPPADGPCDVLGREIWAFIPRTLLPELRLNDGRIDGSPRVEDLFGDFNGDGRREFKTVLTFQTGDGDATLAATRPAVFALDVTDPRSPKILFEYTMDQSPGGRGASELGRGLVVATGFVRNGADTKLYAFAQTNNGGTRACVAPTDCASPATDTCVSNQCVMADGRLEVAKAGSVVTAIDIETGAFVWQHDYPYPAPHTAGNPEVPETGMPGGVTRVDRTGSGFITDITFGTLYGDLWLVDPLTGTSKFDNANPGLPLYSFNTDFHPIGSAPAILDDGTGIQYAVFGTGGFHDQEGGSWDAGANQFGGAISLETKVGELPLASLEPLPNSTATAPPRVRFVRGFDAGESSFSQALIVGTEVFFVTNSTNINGTSFGTSGTSTGRATALSTIGTLISTDILVGGAGSLVNAGTQLYSGSADKQERANFDQDGSVGKGVDGSNVAKVSRKIWLRTE